MLSLDEAIRHAEKIVEEQEKLYRLCPATNYGCKGDKYCNSSYEYDGCLKCAEEYRQLAEWLRDYKGLLEQTQWIPVSERLPKEGEDVLACFYKSEGNYKMMVSRRSDYNYWNGVGRTADMVAWMPLPKPYEPQEREDKE